MSRWQTAITKAKQFDPRSVPGLALWLDGGDTQSLYTTDAGPVVAVASPLDISGCVGWWDASDAATLKQNSNGTTAASAANDPVGYWADKSPSAFNVIQSTAGARPLYRPTGINGLPSVLFDGSNDVLRVTPATPVGAAGVTVFSVFSVVTAGTYVLPPLLLGSGPNARPYDRYQSAGSNIVSIGSASASASLPLRTQTSPFIHSMTVQKDGASTGVHRFQEFANGAGYGTIDITSTYSTASQVIGIGARADGATVLNAHVAEIILFDGVLSSADRSRVEAYLAAKWGIANVHAQATTSSAPVGYWADKSGNGRHATQSTAGNRVERVASDLAGRATLRTYGATSSMAVAAWPYTAANTAVFVFRGSALNQGIYRRGGLNNGPRSALQGSPSVTLRTTIHGTSSTQISALAGYPLNQWAVGASIVSGSSVRAYANGIYSTQENYTGALSGNFDAQLFALNSSGLYPLNGGIAEFLYYDRELSAAELARVAGYLSAKWRLPLAPQVSNADAQDWVNRVYANGGTVSASTASAVNTFCNAIDAAGIRDRFYRLGIFAGSNLSAALVPLYLTPDKTVTNLFQFGTDMTNAAWSGGGNGNVTRAVSAEAGPLGYGRATKMTTPAAPYDFRQLYQFLPATGAQVTVSVWMKTNSGTKQIQWLAGNAYSDTATVTTTWTRFTKTFTLPTSGDTRTGISTVSELNETSHILAWGMQAEYGSTATAYNQPRYGNLTDTNNNFVNSDYTETGSAGGLTPFATNAKWLNTGLSLDTLPILATGHLSAYRAAHTGTDGQMIGLRNAAGDQLYRLYHRGGASQRGDGFWGGGAAAITTDNNGVAGSQIVSRTSATSAKVFTNGSATATLATSITPASVARSFHVFADNDGNATPTSRWFVGVALRAYSIGDGLTDAQALSFHNALTAFQASLGRA